MKLFFGGKCLFAAVVLGALFGGCATSPFRSALGELSAAKQAQVRQQSESYSSPEGAPLASPLADSDELATLFMACLKPALRPHFRHDPLLDLVANESSYYYGARHDVPSAEFMRLAGWRYGRTGDYHHSTYSWAEGGDVGPRLETRLKELCTAINEDTGWQKAGMVDFGVARINFQWSRYIQTFVFYDNKIELNALPKSHPPGAKVRIEAKVYGELDDISLFLDQPDGKVTRLHKKALNKGMLRATLELPKEPGRYFLVVSGNDNGKAKENEVGRGALWNHTLLWVPLYVGQTAALIPFGETQDYLPNPKDPQTWPQLILQSYNAERAKHGLSPLSLAPEASQLAQSHAQRFVENPNEPRDTALQKELEAQGNKAKAEYQFRRSFRLLDALIRGNIEQPSWRYYLLKKSLTQLAVGFAYSEKNKNYEYVEYLLESQPEEAAPEAQDGQEAPNAAESPKAPDVPKAPNGP